jgi:hypothetical protein
MDLNTVKKIYEKRNKRKIKCLEKKNKILKFKRKICETIL